MDHVTEELVNSRIISKDYDVNNPVENGLYLCPDCRKQIDLYPEVYTYDFLKKLKAINHTFELGINTTSQSNPTPPDIIVPHEIEEMIKESTEVVPEQHRKHKLLDFLKRENFSEKGKLIVVKKPHCAYCVIFPQHLENVPISLVLGKKGPRNKDDLVRQGEISRTYDVSDPDDNGLYLCLNCHKLVDRFPEVYTYEFLTRLQQSFHEHFLLEHLKKGTLIDQYPELYTNMLKRLEKSLQEHILSKYVKTQSSSDIVPIQLNSKADDECGSFVCPYCAKSFRCQAQSNLSLHKKCLSKTRLNMSPVWICVYNQTKMPNPC